MNKVTFDELELSKEMRHAILDMGFEEATPIQSESIPEILAHKDLVGQAQTGTGKTAAFGIPLSEMIDKSDKSLQAIILCPTRELAIQTAEEMNKFLKYKKDIHFLPVYGGQPIERQLKALRSKVQIVIGTPGRLMDHMDRGSIKLDKIKMVVLDEADEMLDMGFRDDIESILSTTPQDRQTVMFSATMSKPILSLTKKFQKNPVHIQVQHEKLTVPGIEQIYFEIVNKKKPEALSRLIDINNFTLSLVFCNTKRMVDELVENLQARGYSADGLHGDLKQSSRDRVMQRFRSGKIEILVATDVAARGLDVDDVEAVFNYDMPQDEEYYIHRIGRTGRAGKTGVAFTFASGKDVNRLRNIMKSTKSKIKLQQLPSLDDVEEYRTNLFLEKVKETVDKGGLKKYVHFVEGLMDDDYLSLDIAAALLKMSISSDGGSGKQAQAQQPEYSPRRGGDQRKVRLFFSVGIKDKVKAGNILGAITGETGLPGDVVGAIDVYDKYSFVDIEQDFVDQVLRAMDGSEIRGKRVAVEVAKDK